MPWWPQPQPQSQPLKLDSLVVVPCGRTLSNPTTSVGEALEGTEVVLLACWLLGLGPALEAASLAAVLDAWLVEPVLGWLLHWKWSWWSHCQGRWWVQSQVPILVCQGGSAAEISIAVGCWGSAAKILELTLDVWPFPPQVGPVLAVDLVGCPGLLTWDFHCWFFWLAS